MKKPVELIKQTNIAHGPQQVNIGLEKQIPPNELLEQKLHEQWLDRGTPQEAIRTDSDLETVAKIHRPKVV